jgi:hypothetical protein
MILAQPVHELFVLDVRVVFFADFAVRLSRCAVVMGFRPCGKFAVVGGIFAIPGVPPLAKNDVPVGGPVAPWQTVV